MQDAALFALESALGSALEGFHDGRICVLLIAEFCERCFWYLINLFDESQRRIFKVLVPC